MQLNQVKSIANARHWLTLITSLLLATSITGCASFPSFSLGKGDVKPIEVSTKAIEKTPLDIPTPDPLKLKSMKWSVLTPDNAESIFKQMEQDDQNLVLFALTDDGYQALALTIAELRNMINTQRNIIIKYKEYYEPVKPSTEGDQKNKK